MQSTTNHRARLLTLITVMLLILPVSVVFGVLLAHMRLDIEVLKSSVGSAFLIGLPIFTFELFFVTAPAGARFRQLPLGPFIGLRLAAWGGWIVAGSLIANATVWMTPLERPFAEPDFWWTVGFSFAIALTVTFVLTVSQLLGPGVLGNLLRGRYHRPRTEERAVAFVDLKGSTALAERIGPERFLALMARFAVLVSEEARATGGYTYGYVGDQVILIWEGKRAFDLTPAAAALMHLKRRLAVGADLWQAEFGSCPDFRAALHVGPVVAGEMGDDKRAIVLLGDTMNTTSRLEQAARDLNVDLVCSADAARRIGPVLGMQLIPQAPVALRGKTGAVPVIALAQA